MFSVVCCAVIPNFGTASSDFSSDGTIRAASMHLHISPTKQNEKIQAQAPKQTIIDIDQQVEFSDTFIFTFATILIGNF